MKSYRLGGATVILQSVWVELRVNAITDACAGETTNKILAVNLSSDGSLIIVIGYVEAAIDNAAAIGTRAVPAQAFGQDRILERRCTATGENGSSAGLVCGTPHRR